MEKLPLELLEGVVENLESWELAPWVTISADWQKVIERCTFRELTVYSTDLDEFSATVTGPRHKALKLLEYVVVLPDVANILPDVPEGKRHNFVFTKAIHDLFSVLSLWDAESGLTPIKLSINIIDWYTYGQIDNRHSIFELTDIDNLPSVPMIRKLRKEGDFRISASSWISIASCLPNLESLDADLEDQPRPGVVQPRRNRHEMAAGLNRINVDNLVHIDLWAGHYRSSDTFRSSPSLLLLDGIDHLGLALNRLMRSPNLRLFALRGDFPISSSVFNLADDDIFPRLEHVCISFAASAPNGQPYFHGNMITSSEDNDADNHDHDEDASSSNIGRESSYRWTGAASSLRPLLIAAAGAADVRRMPRLRRFEMETQFRDCRLEYTAPGIEYPACRWAGPDDPLDPAYLWLPRTYIYMPGLEYDREITEAWSAVRMGGLVHWERFEE